VEAAIAAAGFQVARRERIASEWSEYQLEHDPGYLTQDLLEIARLTRNRDQLEATLGPNARQSGCAWPPTCCQPTATSPSPPAWAQPTRSEKAG
jgi:hypothetical protein